MERPAYIGVCAEQGCVGDGLAGFGIELRDLSKICRMVSWDRPRADAVGGEETVRHADRDGVNAWTTGDCRDKWEGGGEVPHWMGFCGCRLGKVPLWEHAFDVLLLMCHNDVMKRTTVVLDDDLLERLRAIARREEVSLATVMREGLEWRAAQAERTPRFIAAGRSTEPPHDTGRRAGELNYTPRSWR